MHRLTVRPTWNTAVVHKMLKGSLNDFQIELMDGMFKQLWILVIKSCFSFQCNNVFVCNKWLYLICLTLRFMEHTSQVSGVPAWKDC